MLAAARRRFSAGHNMHVDSNRCIDNVRRGVAVEISLLHASIFQGNRALGHQLGDAETKPSLELAFDCQWIYGETTIKRNGRAMDFRPFVFNRDVNGASNSRPKTLVTGNAGSMSPRKVVSPGSALFGHQVEGRAQFLCVRFQELASISNRINSGAHS